METEEIPDFTLAEALAEAKRCLKCKVPLCRSGCPIDNDIPAFNAALSQGNIGEAYAIIAERSNLPAVCGRVCPHEVQCEGHCVMNKAKKPPIGIGRIERFIADFEAEFQLNKLRKGAATQGNVAVIGSGPAGLACAGDLVRKGYGVVAYERDLELGGVLTYGIPEFRLPKTVVRREMARLEALGVVFKTGISFGRDITLAGLLADGFDAVFLGIGATVPKKLGVPGEGAPGTVEALGFLHKVHDFEAGAAGRDVVPIGAGDHVVVIGAGNVAMDACRMAKRMGAASVTVCYRRTMAQMRAARAEYDGAVRDGVSFKWEHEPLAFEVTDGSVTGLRAKTSAGETVVPATKIVVAVGSGPAPTLRDYPLFTFDDGGYITTQQEPYYGATGMDAVFAAGDVVHRPRTVVLAMREGKRIATGIDNYCKAKKSAANS